MNDDSKRIRGARPFVFTRQKNGEGMKTMEGLLIREGMLLANKTHSEMRVLLATLPLTALCPGIEGDPLTRATHTRI